MNDVQPVTGMWNSTGEGQDPRARVWSTIQEGVIRRLVNDPEESTLTKWEINILDSNPLQLTCSFGKGGYIYNEENVP